MTQEQIQQLREKYNYTPKPTGSAMGGQMGGRDEAESWVKSLQAKSTKMGGGQTITQAPPNLPGLSPYTDKATAYGVTGGNGLRVMGNMQKTDDIAGDIATNTYNRVKDTASALLPWNLPKTAAGIGKTALAGIFGAESAGGDIIREGEPGYDPSKPSYEQASKEVVQQGGELGDIVRSFKENFLGGATDTAYGYDLSKAKDQLVHDPLTFASDVTSFAGLVPGKAGVAARNIASKPYIDPLGYGSSKILSGQLNVLKGAGNAVRTRTLPQAVKSPIETAKRAYQGDDVYLQNKKNQVIKMLEEDLEPSIPISLRRKQGEYRDFKNVLVDDPEIAANIKIKNNNFDTEDATFLTKTRRNKIGQLIGENVKSLRGQANLDVIETNAINALKDDTTLTARQRQNAAATIKAEIQALKEDINTGITTWEVIQDNISRFDDNINYNTPNPDVINNNVYKVLRDSASDYLFDNVPNQTLKALKTEYGELSNAVDVLKSIDTKPSKGGRLGKYFAQTAGAIAGSAGGVAGSFIGGIASQQFYKIMNDANIPYNMKLNLYKEALNGINPADVKLRKFVEDTFKESMKPGLKMLPAGEAPPELGTEGNPRIVEPNASQRFTGADNSPSTKVSPADFTEYTDPNTGESYFVFRSTPATKNLVSQNVDTTTSRTGGRVVGANEPTPQDIEGYTKQMQGEYFDQNPPLLRPEVETDALKYDPEAEAIYKKFKSYTGKNKMSMEGDTKGEFTGLSGARLMKQIEELGGKEGTMFADKGMEDVLGMFKDRLRIEKMSLEEAKMIASRIKEGGYASFGKVTPERIDSEIKELDQAKKLMRNASMKAKDKREAKKYDVAIKQLLDRQLQLEREYADMVNKANKK